MLLAVVSWVGWMLGGLMFASLLYSLLHFTFAFLFAIIWKEPSDFVMYMMSSVALVLAWSLWIALGYYLLR